MFVIAVEGAVTEPQYFEIIKRIQPKSVVCIKCVKGRCGSSPIDVMKRMKKYLAEERLMPDDEAWLVADKDDWSDEQLGQLYNWSLQRDNYGFALSNPKFEYWLLLHFEDGKSIGSSKGCSERLEKYLPDYDKSIGKNQISKEVVLEAIRRAKLRDKPPCKDWPRKMGVTTVYKLVESILRG